MEAQIKTLYTDKNKDTVLLPKTNTKAVSNSEGVGLDVLLEEKASKEYVQKEI